MKKKRSKAYYDYEEIIENLDIENTTSVEIDALTDEMIHNNDLSNAEFCTLIATLLDMTE